MTSPIAATKTIVQQFFENSERFPQKDLFVRQEQSNVTFAQAMNLTQKLATVLLGLGVRKGDRVAVQTEKSVEAVCLYLACAQVGAVYLPLNTAYTPSEVNYFLQDAEPRVFVCSADGFDRENLNAQNVMAIETLNGSGGGSLMTLAEASEPTGECTEVGPDDLAAILYTSGTTGRSKGAMLTHENLMSNCSALLEAWQFTDQDHLIHALPIFHTHGLFVACNMVLSSGASMDFLTRFDAEQIITLFGNATVLMGVPTFYTRLLKSKNLTRQSVSGMRLFISGSAPLLKETHDQFNARTGQAVLERYGMTETCMNTSNPYEGDRRPGTVGLPLPGIQIRIVGEDKTVPLKMGETGAIEVKGPNVFKGYWNMPEKTATEFTPDGFFITGDLGGVDERGYLKIVGRDKDLIISGGYNIYPKEIELLIDDLPGVLESAVIGLPMADLGEGVVAVVVPDHSKEISEAEILNGLQENLARFKQPRKVILIDELPRNVMGKVQKNILRETLAGTFEPNKTKEQRS